MRGKRPTVLLLDDDAAFLGWFGARLERSGFEVVRVMTPEQAVAAANRVDYMVLDYYLPGVSKRDFIKLVQALRGRNPSLRGIVLSNVTDPDVRVQAMVNHLVWFGKLEAAGDCWPDFVKAVKNGVEAAYQPGHFGEVMLRDSRTVTVDGVTVRLGWVAFAVLEMLGRHPKQVVRNMDLYSCLDFGDGSALKNQVSKLRRVLREGGIYVDIRAHPGKGYALYELRALREEDGDLDR